MISEWFLNEMGLAAFNIIYVEESQKYLTSQDLSSNERNLQFLEYFTLFWSKPPLELSPLIWDIQAVNQFLEIDANLFVDEEKQHRKNAIRSILKLD